MTTEVRPGDRVKAEPVVGNDDHGTMHEVFYGEVLSRVPEDKDPWIGEDIVYVEPDGPEEKRPVRTRFVEVVEDA